MKIRGFWSGLTRCRCGSLLQYRAARRDCYSGDKSPHSKGCRTRSRKPTLEWGFKAVTRPVHSAKNIRKLLHILSHKISVSFSGNRAGELELSPQRSYLQRSLYAALTRGLYTREGLEAIARHAYFARQTEVIKEASQLMLALPLSKELKSVAQYYQAFCTWKQGDADEAQRILSQVVDTASLPYRAQGLLSTGGIYFAQGKIEAALPYYLAAARGARKHDTQTFVTAQRMIAVMRSIYGDHQQALADLERLLPIVQVIARHYPAFYHDFLNSYAVELGEVGRITEAQNVCAVTLASPFVAAYPEFAQTHDELAAKRTAARPSIIAVSAAALEIVAAPQAQVEPEPVRAHSTISLKLRRYCLLSRMLTMASLCVVIRFVSLPTILDQFAKSILPRGPPALS
ncbi:MAG: hypothetical protein V7641_4128 [Blastocatellia bacterium]